MAQQGGGGAFPTYFDRTRQKRYYYDPRTNEFVYEDGYRIAAQPSPSDPRTPNLPVSRGGQQVVASHSRPQDATSPTREPHYAYNQAAQQPPLGGRRPSHSSSLEQDMDNLSLASRPPFTRRFKQHGITYTDVQNPQSQVRTITGTEPANLITDPYLFQSGYRAQQMVVENSGPQADNLYPKYRLQPRAFFKLGRVFMVLWAEPAGESRFSVASIPELGDRSFSVGAYNERVHSKVRRFVVIREGGAYCSALPITTYGGQGVAKASVQKSEHAIIYTGREAPQVHPSELPGRGEGGMRPIPIRVIPDETTETLDPMSRIDFGKIHTVQHNLKVRPLGNVHPHSMDALQNQFANVWGKTAVPAPFTPAASAHDSRGQGSLTASRSASEQATQSDHRGSARSVSSRATRNDQRSSRQPAREEGEDSSESDSSEDDGETQAGTTVRRPVYSNSVTARPPPTQQSMQTQAQLSTATAQAALANRRSQIRSNYNRLTQSGYGHQRAVADLVAALEGQGQSRQSADAEVRAALSSNRP